jgi:hypothetical protein
MTKRLYATCITGKKVGRLTYAYCIVAAENLNDAKKQAAAMAIKMYPKEEGYMIQESGPLSDITELAEKFVSTGDI